MASKAVEAVMFLQENQGDIEDKKPTGYRKDFAEDKPLKSILQRADKDLDEVLKIFDWKEDDNNCVKEYKKDGGPDIEKFVRFRRRICFLVGGWREFNEDFGRGDVSCLRDIRTPLVTSRTPLKAMIDDFNEQ